MRARASLLTILSLLIIGCLDWSSALFFKKSWKSANGYGEDECPLEIGKDAPTRT
ncbi:hypothetical protein M5D96_000882 [Drosophila gunungcola]|uniref:Uncharacterized protein n=1 Tax=Drosophila gunungcola TaxID=103775 RepID=A0A9P9YX37_9MUSC|nr:hypothetical protein M5D96_000882 [Drosophila gunungcola]